MTNIKAVIARYRGNMETAGLIRQVSAVQLSPQVAAMRPSLTKVRMALAERPDRFAIVQPSPMSLLFDYTLPKIEPILIELGEERAEQIVNHLCEHGQKMINEHGVDGSKEHLEGLFKDLPDYETELKDKDGIGEIIKLYRELGRDRAYLRLKLGDKIEKLEVDDNGMISLEMKQETNDPDLVYLRKVKNLQELDLNKTQVSDVTSLSGLINLELLNLAETQVSDVSPLSGLINLQKLYLEYSKVSDVTPLSGLINLQVLYLWGTRVSNVTPLSGLKNLQVLNLEETKVGDVSPLSGLINLQKLNLHGTSVRDITPLSGLINLQALDLSGTQVSDVGPLSGLINLQELYLEKTQVRNAGIRRLEEAIPGVKIIK